ncbi:MAG: ATP-binding cassette domain-containing protein [Myxococcales bacterium]|nr:ATP-binding cassette domain-containing protein [Myxococcales bacterium]USN50832.1 MAG: ATP-binding cassette domain-containing protein [Myxococcales bacterium]
MYFLPSWVFSFVFLSSIAGLSIDHDKERITNEIIKKITGGNEHISEQAEQAIILVGPSGAGKSTLALCLAGVPLRGHYDDVTGEIKIIPVSTEYQDRISSSQIPYRYITAQSNTDERTIIWDTPGFNTHELSQAIANNFYRKQLYDHHKKLKFVLVVSEASITAENGALFISIFEQFCENFNDIQELNGSVALVVTHVKPLKKVEHLANTLLYIHNNNHSMSDKAKIMLGQIINKIALFHQPQSEESIKETTIFDTIHKATSFTKKNANLGKYDLPHESLDIYRSLLELISSNLQSITAIIKDSVIYLSNFNNNHYVEINYSNFKLWTPSYRNENSCNNNASNNDYFQFIKQLYDLTLTTQCIEDEHFDKNNLEAITKLSVNIFRTLEKYADTDALREKNYNLSVVVQQMTSYHQILGSFIGPEYEQLQKQLSNLLFILLKDSYETLKNRLKDSVIEMDVFKDNSADKEYYQTAISYLINYPYNSACVNKRALCHNRLGDLWREENSYKVALGHYAEALKLNKTMVEPYNKMGEIFSHLTEWKKAIKLFTITENLIGLEKCYKKMTKTEPDCAVIYEQWGDMYRQFGLCSEAQKNYQRANGLTDEKDRKLTLCNKIADCLENKEQYNLANNYKEKAKSKKFYDVDELDLEQLLDELECKN